MWRLLKAASYVVPVPALCSRSFNIHDPSYIALQATTAGILADSEQQPVVKFQPGPLLTASASRFGSDTASPSEVSETCQLD